MDHNMVIKQLYPNYDINSHKITYKILKVAQSAVSKNLFVAA